MHVKGLEPSRVAPLVPKTSASTDSAIRAGGGITLRSRLATCFIILTDKQENSHTEGVWHHHYIFNWNAETRQK